MMGLIESMIREEYSDPVNNGTDRSNAKTNQNGRQRYRITVGPPTKSEHMGRVAVPKTTVETERIYQDNGHEKTDKEGAQGGSILQQLLVGEMEQWDKERDKRDIQGIEKGGQKSINLLKEGSTASEVAKIDYFAAMYEQFKLKRRNMPVGKHGVPNTVLGTKTKTMSNNKNQVLSENSTKTMVNDKNSVINTNGKRPWESYPNMEPPNKLMVIPGLDKYDNRLYINLLPDGSVCMADSSQAVAEEDVRNMDLHQLLNGTIILDRDLDHPLDELLQGAVDSPTGRHGAPPPPYDSPLDLSVGSSALNMSMEALECGVPDAVKLPSSNQTKQEKTSKV